jgi:2-aminoadipate transaminase
MVTFARRAQNQSDELTAILAGSPEGVLSLAGGFPNPATFPSELLDEIMARLVREDAGVALQYAPCEGIPSLREYLVDRQEQLQGRRPQYEELIVTSGGMECIALACQSLIDPGDTVAVEAPTYLGALMAFDRYEAEIEGIAMDEDGLVVEALEQRLAGGLRPKLLYVIPEFQNPTGRTLPLARREALVELCRREGVRIARSPSTAQRCRRSGRWRLTWWCRPARSRRSSARASGWAGRSGRAR